MTCSLDQSYFSWLVVNIEQTLSVTVLEQPLSSTIEPHNAAP